jgi:hypothetical protein
MIIDKQSLIYELALNSSKGLKDADNLYEQAYREALCHAFITARNTVVNRFNSVASDKSMDPITQTDIDTAIYHAAILAELKQQCYMK